MANATSVWVQMLKDLEFAPVFAPRKMETKELLGYQTRVSMAEPMVSIKERDIGHKFRYAEAAWILSGDNRVATISPYSKMIHKFSDDGVRYFGSYGVKVVDQLPYVIETLANDESSRQAIISIWRENPRPSKDIPCTLTLQFIIRKNILYCNATMRSSDAWLGWVYDVFNFSQISLYVLLQLKAQYNIKLKLCHLILTAGSQHLYKQHWQKATDCIFGNQFTPEKTKLDFKDGQQLIDYLWSKANENYDEHKQQVLPGIV